MSTLTHHQHRIEDRRLIPAIIALIGVSWLGINQFGLSGPLSLALAAQIALFILLFHRPVWALAALMVGQLTASNYMLDLSPGVQISIRFLWTVLALLLVVPMLMQKGTIGLGNKARRILIPAIIFIALATIANVVNADLALAFKYLRQAATALAILILLPAVVEEERDVKLLALVVLITCAISAAAAVMQHYSLMGLPIYTLFADSFRRGRSLGLAEGAVQLAYQLPMVLLPVFGIVLLRGAGRSATKWLVLLALIMGLALYFTYTRSGIFALGAGILALLFLLKSKWKTQLFLALLLVGVAFWYFVNMENSRYSLGFSEEQSAAGRLVLWQAGINIALDNPVFGIGYDKFQETSVEYSSTINPPDEEEQDARGVLGSQDAHNDFIRIWLSFGTPAFLAFLWLFIGIFRNFLDSYRQSPSRFLKGLSIGCAASMAAYVLNAFTHNVMDSVFILWILGGLSVALVKLAGAPKSSAVGKRP